MALKITRKDPKAVLVASRDLVAGDTVVCEGGPGIVTFTSHMNKVVRVLLFESGKIVKLLWNDHYNLIDCELTYTTRKEVANAPSQVRP